MLHLIFGGTFDPIHLGHLQIAKIICDYFSFPACYFLPNAQPAQYKTPQASISARKAMLETALTELQAYDQRFYLDDRELKRTGYSYSLDTLQEIRKELNNTTKIFWLMGSDSFNQLTDWYNWEKLFELTNFIVVTRPKHPLEPAKNLAAYYQNRKIQDKTQFLQQTHGSIYLFDKLNLDISSTAIRHILNTKKVTEPTLQHIPSGVYQYILQHKLYQKPL